MANSSAICSARSCAWLAKAARASKMSWFSSLPRSGHQAICRLPQVVLDDRGHQADDLVWAGLGDWLDADHVPQHGDADELRRYEGRPQVRVGVGGEPGDDAQQRGGDELAEHGGGPVVGDGGADECQERVAAFVAVDDLQVDAGECLSSVGDGEGSQAGEHLRQDGGQAGSGEEESLFAAEVLDEKRRFDFGVSGDGAQRGGIVAAGCELSAGDSQDRVAGGGGSGPAAGAGHAGVGVETMATKASSRLAATTSVVASRPSRESNSPMSAAGSLTRSAWPCTWTEKPLASST